MYLLISGESKEKIMSRHHFFLVGLVSILFMGCTHKMNHISSKIAMQSEFPEALPHGQIMNVIDDIFIVSGTNIFMYDGSRIQASRTMPKVPEKNGLNTVTSIHTK